MDKIIIKYMIDSMTLNNLYTYCSLTVSGFVSIMHTGAVSTGYYLIDIFGCKSRKYKTQGTQTEKRRSISPIRVRVKDPMEEAAYTFVDQIRDVATQQVKTVFKHLHGYNE